ncbi:helix-turn-helix domain-containing protein [Arthrobacter sp. VKM Ac-2550]|uniref:helix-turn-helix domain-containing protein n=1 Tax=Crystallibacter permensis TaxID=1938888 RepID=UPI0022279A7C|nr:helix-turn-helix domain-containing protein [Arthrobacter sp. VKM Ac-2550]MCW2135381.1 hypothetical protein [Arthrobacter sp. VKM Ac-2550]
MRRHPPELVARVLRDRARGISRAEVARIHSIHPSTVARWERAEEESVELQSGARGQRNAEPPKSEVLKRFDLDDEAYEDWAAGLRKYRWYERLYFVLALLLYAPLLPTHFLVTETILLWLDLSRLPPVLATIAAFVAGFGPTFILWPLTMVTTNLILKRLWPFERAVDHLEAAQKKLTALLLKCQSGPALTSRSRRKHLRRVSPSLRKAWFLLHNTDRASRRDMTPHAYKAELTDRRNVAANISIADTRLYREGPDAYQAVLELLRIAQNMTIMRNWSLVQLQRYDPVEPEKRSRWRGLLAFFERVAYVVGAFYGLTNPDIPARVDRAWEFLERLNFLP